MPASWSFGISSLSINSPISGDLTGMGARFNVRETDNLAGCG